MKTKNQKKNMVKEDTYIYIYIYSAETREVAVTITSNMVVQKPHCT